MSNLLVQNIKHTNNTTAIEINSSAQMTVKSDGGATTTSLQQGLLKCWANIDMASSTQAFRDSFNTSGVTDNGSGRSEISFSNNFNNDDYAGAGINKDGSDYNDVANIACDFSGAMSTSAFEVFTTHGGASANNASGNDSNFAQVMIAGDLA